MGELISRAWRWWCSELSALVPSWMKVAFWGDVSAYPLEFKDGIHGIIRNKKSWIAPTDVFFAHPPIYPKVTNGIHVNVTMPESQILRREILMPETSPKNLKDFARFDLRQNTPFAEKDVYWALSQPTFAQENIMGQQVIVRKSDIEIMHSRLADLGLKVKRVYANDALDGPKIQLVDFSRNIAPRSLRLKVINVLLVFAIAIGLFFHWLQPAWHAQQISKTLVQDVDSLRQETFALRRETDDRLSANDQAETLVTTLLKRPKLVEILREITVTLPDAAWVTTLDFQPASIQFSGETQDRAVDLILGLSEKSYFKAARLVGPTTRTASGAERFQITVEPKGAE